MFKNNYKCRELIWDTDFFGVKSARVDLEGEVVEEFHKEILDFCNNYEFITICNIDNVNENNSWIGKKTNAFLTDINIQFLRILDQQIDYHSDNTFVESNMDRNGEIEGIAQKSFVHSRFFNDTNLDIEKSRDVYLHWTENAFNKEDKYFAVYKHENKIMGYILFSLKEYSSVIELIAVDENSQGQKIGKSLIKTMEAFVTKKGIFRIEVGTQVNNISSIQFYNALGFDYVGCRSIYHLWRDI